MALSIGPQYKEVMMVPFVLLASFFMITFKPHLGLPPETLSAALVKAAPIWYLAAYVGITPNFAKNPLAVGARAGLALSSLGDIFLVWRTSLFLPGMLCFALAHAAYIYGLVSWIRLGNYPTGRYTREIALAGILLYLFLFTGIESWLMAVCVFGYSTILNIMANLALQRHLVEGDRGSFYCFWGAVSFVVSDTIIGIERWKLWVPYSEGLVMITYYFAQAAIAFGTVSSARSKRRD